jgi:hypothetical protein
MDTELILLGIVGIVFIFGLIIILTKRKKPKLKSSSSPSSTPSVVEKPKSEWSSFEHPAPKEGEKTQYVVGADIGHTEITKKFNFSLDALMITCVLAGFLALLYAYINPKAAVVSILVGGLLFIPIGAMVGVMFSGNFRVKILKRLTRRNYGYVRFLSSNRLIKTVVANLDKDVVKFGDGIYLIDKQSIKREGEDTPSSDVIDESKIKFEEGISTIYYDIDDIMPIDFDTSRKNPLAQEDKFRLPTQVSATLNKEIAVEKAKAMKAFKTQQNVLMIAMLAMIVLTLYFSYSIYANNKKLVDTIGSVRASMDILRTEFITRFPAITNATQPAVIPT